MRRRPSRLRIVLAAGVVVVWFFALWMFLSGYRLEANILAGGVVLAAAMGQLVHRYATARKD